MTKIIYVVIALAALTTGVLLFTQLNQQNQPEHALFYEQAREIKPFVMTDQNGNNFSNEELKGKWSWVFFGYTSCPDVCPTTLQELNFVYDDMKNIASNTQVILVSVDPKRDTTEKLAGYIKYFNKEFIALNSGHDVLFPFARNLGLMYAMNDGERAENNMYTVDHSASIVLINPNGNIAAIFQPHQVLGRLPTVEGDDLVSDFAKIVNLSGFNAN
ncbi:MULTISPECIES: SCO family protein [Colwelliaceae]|uniref:SCO family protein n=1 Tax=Colwelliaceae TaxID=267889 RepID=UPI00097043A8|nr:MULTISPECIES: SCO family protein [Colwelliaceae]